MLRIKTLCKIDCCHIQTRFSINFDDAKNNSKWNWTQNCNWTSNFELRATSWHGIAIWGVYSPGGQILDPFIPIFLNLEYFKGEISKFPPKMRGSHSLLAFFFIFCFLLLISSVPLVDFPFFSFFSSPPCFFEILGLVSPNFPRPGIVKMKLDPESQFRYAIGTHFQLLPIILNKLRHNSSYP